VCHDLLQRSVQWGTILTNALLKTTEFVLTVTRAPSKWPPNTECVTIFYRRSVQWGTILTSALLKTTDRIHWHWVAPRVLTDCSSPTGEISNCYLGKHLECSLGRHRNCYLGKQLECSLGRHQIAMHRSAWVCLSAPMISNQMTGIDKLICLFKSFRMIVLNIYWTRIGTLSTTWNCVPRLFFSHRRNFWVLSTPPTQTCEIDLRTSEFFSIVARARSKSHTTPNTECVTFFLQDIRVSSVR